MHLNLSSLFYTFISLILTIKLPRHFADDGASGYTSRYNMNKCGYSPFFPATSPYVTSVGATQVREILQHSK